MGLRFRGSYDTIQILLAAYAGKCVLREAISLRSPDFLCQAALIHMALRWGPCVNSLMFQLEGPADSYSVTHGSLSLMKQLNHHVALSAASPEIFPPTP